MGDVGYRRLAGSAPNSNQGIVSFSGYYGDPFAGEITHPFDSFWMGIDLNQKGGALVSRIEERGVLRGWELTDPEDPVRHVAGFSQEYEYFNNAAQVFGAEILSAGVLSRYRLGEGLNAMTDVGFLAVPLAGVQTTDFANPSTGRNYDYGSGGGVRVAGRVLARGREILTAGYGIVWMRTVNGVSRNNTLQYARGALRIPVFGAVGVGAAYAWYSRKTTYPDFFEARRAQSEWRLFLDWIIGKRFGQTP